MFYCAPLHSERFPFPFFYKQGDSSQHIYLSWIHALYTNVAMSLFFTIALHIAKLYNHSGAGERKRLPTEHLIAPTAPSLTSATFRSYLFPSIFYLFLFPSAHPYFCLLSPPLSKSASVSSSSEITTKARLLALLPLSCHPALLSLCAFFFLSLSFSPS